MVPNMLSRGLLRYGVVFAAIIFVCLNTFQITRATPGDWFSEASSVSVTDDSYTNQNCQNTDVEYVAEQPWLNNGNPTTGSLCVTKGKNVDIAMGNARTMYVKYSGDSVYRLLMTGYGVLTPGTNVYTMVSEDFQNTLTVVKDISAALQVQATNTLGGIVSYKINPDRLEKQLPKINEPGWYHGVTSYAVAANAKYIAAYVDYGGVVIINLESGAVTKVLRLEGGGSNYGYNPNVQAISEDGRFVLVGNSVTIVDTKDCGDPFTTPFDSEHPLKNVCKSKEFANTVNPLVGYSYYVNDPHFSDEGYKLEFRATLWGGPPAGVNTSPKHVVLKASGYVAEPRLDYLALGDSYSSGEGDGERQDNGLSYYLPLTDTGKDLCHVSSRSYPFLLKTLWGIEENKMKSVACSGAQLALDYYAQNKTYYGQQRRLLNVDNADYLKTVAVEKFIPGRVPQLEFIKKYKPKILTFTGGGNDVGFEDILTYCATPSWEGIMIDDTCDYARPGSELERTLYESIDTQYTYTKRFIEDIKQASPATKVIIVGYPSFIANHTAISCTLNGGALNVQERTMINNAVEHMNDMLKKVAQDESINFVDIEDSLNGGRICEGSEYITGVWLNIIGKVQESERFHPNNRGHQKIADAIYNSGVYASSVRPKSTFQPQENKNVRKATLIDDDGALVDHDMNIDSGGGMLKVGSQYEMVGFSKPRSLGLFFATSDGSAKATISLKGMSIGRHVLLLKGIDTDNNPVTYYQFIQIMATMDDVDGDGIPNNEDKCDYITNWYDEGSGEDICRILITSDGSGGFKNDRKVDRSANVLLNNDSNDSLSLIEADKSRVTTVQARPLATVDATTGSIDGEHRNKSLFNFWSAIALLGILFIIVYIIKKYAYAKKKNLKAEP